MLLRPVNIFLGVFLQLALVYSSSREGAHTLCFNLTIKSHSRLGKSSDNVQGFVDQMPFLQSDDNDEIKPLGLLGKKVNATKAWTDLTQMLEDVRHALRQQLHLVKLDNITGPSTMQAKLSCRCEGKRITNASWEFNINGDPALFDSMTMNWTVIRPAAQGIWKKWESNKELTEHFRKTSLGDCSHWLMEFLEYREEMLEQPVATKTLDMYQQSSSTQLKTWNILWILFYLFLYVFY